MPMNKNITLGAGLRAIILFLLLSLLLVAEWTQPASAATDGEQMAERIWYDVDEKSIESQGTRRVIPDLYRTLRIDYEALVNRLDRAPMEFTDEAYTIDTIMVIPLPDGVDERFRIFESPVMAQGLATKFPEIKTYSAIGVDDPHASGRLDLTPAGFHAMIFSTSGTFYIDPYSVGDASYYISYFKQDYSAPEDLVYEELGPLGDPELLEPPAELSSGENLRTHRLAQATTGEYSIFHGGTVPSVMAEVVTAINRVTGIYEREVAVRLELIDNNDLLIFLNPATDPYTNSSGGAMLSQNQATIDSIIGDANYDIGHVFSTGGGGIARLSAVCNSGQKAQGVTGLTSPIGDPFYVDYVAHEMGHQYGGHHTFNGIASNCAGNRNSSTAYEPGSGTTIMAYAGICGQDNTQTYSDDYFHTISFQEIVNYTTTGNGRTCGIETDTGNSAPEVDAGEGGFTIPIETPFTLTGSAVDPDDDPMTYNWEEFDRGPAGHPNTPAGNAPIFRSFLAKTTPSRTFPQISDIVNNTQTIGEILPTYSRDLTFRLTARDNHAYPSAGGVAYDSIAFDVTDQAGPFLVTAPNTATNWTVGSLQGVSWDVANTDAAPVSCTSVNIRLSTDGGYTFPHLLVSDTPNDGTHYLPVPDLPSSSARIKVECNDNIFFDISNVDFSISVAPPYAELAPSKSVEPTGVLEPGSVLTYTIDIINRGNVTATTTVTDTFDANLVNPTCDGIPGDLADQQDIPGASWSTYECTAQVDPSLQIQINKVVDDPIIFAGTTVTYTITVTNPNASTSIENVIVSDPDVGECSPNLGTPISLGPLVSQTYVCPEVVLTGDITNTADVNGEVVIDNFVTASAPEDTNSPVSSNTVRNLVSLFDSDSATVIVRFASISVTKMVNPATYLAPGDTLTYTIAITNSGNFTATTTVTDTFDANLVNPICDGVPGDLADQVDISAASATAYHCTAQIDPSLSILIEKVVDDPSAAAGTAVTFTITVTNPNASTLIENVVVSDPDVGDCTPSLSVPIQLNPLASQEYICPDVLVTGNMMNTAEVTGQFSITNFATVYAPEDTNSPVSSNIVESTVILSASDSASVIVSSYIPLLLNNTGSLAPPISTAPVMGLSIAAAGMGIVFTVRKRHR